MRRPMLIANSLRLKSMGLRRMGLAVGFVAVAAGGGSAWADEVVYGGEVADDPATLSVIVENDLLHNTDRHYTNGLRLEYVTPREGVPDWARDAAEWTGLFPEDGRYRAVYSLGQNMYTPRDISDPTPDPDDRPYAGWLYGSIGLIAENDKRLNSLELLLGVVGPASQADDTQTMWHDLIGADEPQGWDFQIKNEPILQLTYQRRWRMIEDRGGFFEWGVMPHAGAALGNALTYANAGGSVRIGQNIPEDYGPPRIQPSAPGSGWFRSNGLGWYAFAGVDGRVVGYNIFLDGNTFRDSRSVDRNVFVADLQVGVVVTIWDWRLAFTNVYRTEQYSTQDDADLFSALSISTQF